jgi:hypothetical protein
VRDPRALAGQDGGKQATAKKASVNSTFGFSIFRFGLHKGRLKIAFPRLFEQMVFCDDNRQQARYGPQNSF